MDTSHEGTNSDKSVPSVSHHCHEKDGPVGQCS